jgi:zinc transport system substrate-binding protein
VNTIYFETLVSRDLADTVASETGADTEVLDPIEGLSDEAQGSDYLEIMRSNLDNIRSGQPCT